MKSSIFLLTLLGLLFFVSRSSADQTISSVQLILFNGDQEKWTTILQTEEGTVGAAIQTAISTLLYRPDITTVATVNTLTAYPADPSFTSMGDGSSGLLVSVSIVETFADDVVHPYDVSEINSLLFQLTVPELSTAYGSDVTVQTVAVDRSYDLQCTALCKGMIGAGVVLGFFMLAFLIILVFYSACPSIFLRYREKKNNRV